MCDVRQNLNTLLVLFFHFYFDFRVNNICMEKGYYRGVTFSDNWSFWWWVGALVCTNHHYQVSRALGLIICTPEYKMLVQNGQKRHFQPTHNILFTHIFLYQILSLGFRFFHDSWRKDLISHFNKFELFVVVNFAGI